MSTENEFIITLPSNASSSIFPDNKAENYKTILAKPLELEGKWEVAILEIQMPPPCISLNTITELIIQIGRKDVRGNFQEEGAPQGHKQKVLTQMNIGKGRYLSFDELTLTLLPSKFNTIDELLKDFQKGLSLTCHAYCQPVEDDPDDERGNKPEAPPILLYEVYERTGRILLKSRTKINIVTRGNSELMELLGMVSHFKQDGEFKYATLPIESNAPKAFMNYRSVYIYSDVVKHQHVGDTLAPLLGIAPINKSHADAGFWHWNPPQYVQVRQGYISSIEMQLNLDTGQLLNFQSGKVVVRLHFRRCGGIV